MGEMSVPMQCADGYCSAKSLWAGRSMPKPEAGVGRPAGKCWTHTSQMPVPVPTSRILWGRVRCQFRWPDMKMREAAHINLVPERRLEQVIVEEEEVVVVPSMSVNGKFLAERSRRISVAAGKCGGLEVTHVMSRPSFCWSSLGAL
jgi:hypothetical protein